MAAPKKAATKAPQQEQENEPVDRLAAARAARTKGSRLPAEELMVTNRLGDLRNIQGQRALTDAEKKEKDSLTTRKKQMSFKRLATKYLKAAKKSISDIQNLSSGSYISEPAQVEKIASVLTDSVAGCIASFSKTVAANEEIEL